MHTREQALAILDSADLICSAEFVSASIARVATEITQVLGERYPVVLSVMGGGYCFCRSIIAAIAVPSGH